MSKTELYQIKLRHSVIMSLLWAQTAMIASLMGTHTVVVSVLAACSALAFIVAVLAASKTHSD